MSPFELEIPGHAQERLKQRGIRRPQVRECIVRGILVGIDAKGRRIRQLQCGQKLLEVVYLAKSGGFTIVTAWWKGEYS